MELKDFKRKIDKIKELNPEFTYILSEGAETFKTKKLEERIGQKIPDTVKKFWSNFDGLETSNPEFKILKLDDFELKNGLIHFATFDGKHKIYFDTRKLNRAEQWSILNFENDYILTMTMSSFWSNKIWHWLDNQTEIWNDKYWIKENKK